MKFGIPRAAPLCLFGICIFGCTSPSLLVKGFAPLPSYSLQAPRISSKFAVDIRLSTKATPTCTWTWTWTCTWTDSRKSKLGISGDCNHQEQSSSITDLKSILFGIFLYTFTMCTPQCALALANEQMAPSTTTSASASPSPSTPMNKSKYWSLMESTDITQIQTANERLIDHAVGTINTMYYDNSGGARFTTKDMYDRWKILKTFALEGVEGVRGLTSARDVSKFKKREEQQSIVFKKDSFIPQLFLVEGDTVNVQKQHLFYENDLVPKMKMPAHAFDSRADAVTSLKWLVSTLEDPYSKYLTREELEQEFQAWNGGFLGLGAIVEPPPRNNAVITNGQGATQGQGVQGNTALITSTRVANLPIVTAIAPDSPAERAGIVVGDRIAAVGADKFLGFGRDEVLKRLNGVYSGAENYIGYPDLTVAKPIVRSIGDLNVMEVNYDGAAEGGLGVGPGREELVGYKLSRVRIPTTSLEPFKVYKPTTDGTSTIANLPGAVPPASAATTVATPFLSGGDAIVHWELLTPNDSIFRKYNMGSQVEASSMRDTDKVGYIRLTRFSRLSTAGYSKAIEELEKAGAQSYIIDVRNNYGGIIQESMLTAATLLRDPHAVLCYTLNSRGGFTPHDAEEYIVDDRYPGYLLSSEPKSSTFQQVKRGEYSTM